MFNWLFECLNRFLGRNDVVTKHTSIDTSGLYELTYYCPHCGEELVVSNNDYPPKKCVSCGRHLYWKGSATLIYNVSEEETDEE